jgi:FKBP-type peptidyl-prolyl cis-trans isomerase SlyD
MSARHRVGPDTVVHFSYWLFDEDGELVERSESPPLSFLFGYGQVNPVLEGCLEGLAAGEQRRVKLPKDAFGSRDPSAIIEVARQELPVGAAVGDEFEADHDELGPVSLKVLDLDDERAVLDGNHPLAGQAALVEVRVEAVRPATSAELHLAQEDLETRAMAPECLLPGSRLVQRPPASATPPPFATRSESRPLNLVPEGRGGTR